MSYPTTLPDICEGFIPQPCFSYINCTATGFKAHWRRGHGRKKNKKYVLCVLVSIWICAISIQSISLLEVFGQYGYDAVDSMCHIIECEK
jgi:hypothetical protein